MTDLNDALLTAWKLCAAYEPTLFVKRYGQAFHAAFNECVMTRLLMRTWVDYTSADEEPRDDLEIAESFADYTRTREGWDLLPNDTRSPEWGYVREVYYAGWRAAEWALAQEMEGDSNEQG